MEKYTYIDNGKEHTIKVGDVYNSYDDGKVRVSRQHVVRIVNIIPLKSAFPRTKEIVRKEIKDIDWLFDKVKHEVILTARDENNNKCMFLRTQDGGWFTMGLMSAGRLDVTDELTESLIEDLKEGYYDYSEEQVEHFIGCLKRHEICEEINETKAIINLLKP